MKGDFSKWKLHERKNYRGVLHQQGRVLLDSDWNAQTLSDNYWEDQAGRDIIGHDVAAVPASEPDSFKIKHAFVTSAGKVALDIGSGRAWADGLLSHLQGDPEGTDVVRTSAYLAAPIQVPAGNTADIDAGVKDAVVLEVWKEAFNGYQIPNELMEPALGGPDTTERIHTSMRFRLLRLKAGETCSSVAGKLRDDLDDRGRLTVSLLPVKEIEGECPATQGGGYTGFEHNLYRIEIAQVNSGVLNSKGPMFKWSQFNGGLVGRGRCSLSGNDKKISITANDQAIKMSGLDDFYLEIIQYDEEQGFWRTTYGAKVTLNGDDLDVVEDEVYYSEQPLPSDSVFFRLWNGIESLNEFAGSVNAGKAKELRDGILLDFDPTSQAEYIPGDYWTVPMRAGDISQILSSAFDEEIMADSDGLKQELIDAFQEHGVALSQNVILGRKGKNWQIRDMGKGEIYTGREKGEKLSIGLPSLRKKGTQDDDEKSGTSKASHKLIFTLDRKYKSFMDHNKRVDNKIRKAFDDQGVQLSRTSRTTRVDDDHWTIDEKTKTYRIMDDGKKLDIYNNDKNPKNISGTGEKTGFSIRNPFREKRKQFLEHTLPTLLHNASPEGIVYHRVPLAILNWNNTRAISFEDEEIQDCRDVFHPLTKQNICCTLTVGDGISSFGDFDSIKEAVRHLPRAGGDICLLPGLHRANVLINGRQNIKIRGCGGRSKVIPPRSGWDEPVFTILDSQSIVITNVEVDSLGGPCIIVAGSSIGTTRGIEISKCRILGHTHGIRVKNGVDVSILENKIRLWDRDGGEAGIRAGGEDMDIQENSVQVIPSEFFKVLQENSKGMNLPDPMDSREDPSTFYNNMADLKIIVNTVWSGTRSHDPSSSAYSASGGIQIDSGSEHIRILNNMINGGSGNGITLGTHPDWEKLKQSPSNEKTDEVKSIFSEGKKVAWVVRSVDEAPLPGVAFSVESGGTSHQKVSGMNGYLFQHQGKGNFSIPVLSPNYRVKDIKRESNPTLAKSTNAEIVNRITVEKVKQEPIGSNHHLGFIYNVLIEENDIANMGLSGIGIPRIKQQQAPILQQMRTMSLQQPQMTLSTELSTKFGMVGGFVVDLSIKDNVISDCLQSTGESISKEELLGHGLGGISLGFCENLVIHGNAIEKNGGSQGNPVCGIFVLYANQADIHRNSIHENGLVDTETTLIRKGIWGGIVVFLSTSLWKSTNRSRNLKMRVKGDPAARVHDNVVDQPVGRSLTLNAMGPVAITNNHFNSELSAPGMINTLVGGVLVNNIGGGLQRMRESLVSYILEMKKKESPGTTRPGIMQTPPIQAYPTFVGEMQRATPVSQVTLSDSQLASMGMSARVTDKGGARAVGGQGGGKSIAGIGRGRGSYSDMGLEMGLAGREKKGSRSQETAPANQGAQHLAQGMMMQAQPVQAAQYQQAGMQMANVTGLIRPPYQTLPYIPPVEMPVIPMLPVYPDIEMFNPLIPAGNTLFNENQTRLGPKNTSLLSQLIVSADDLGFNGNQSEIMHERYMVNTLLFGNSVTATVSRFVEIVKAGENARKLSLLTMSRLLNNTNQNQGNHCIIGTSLVESQYPNIGYLNTQFNLVLHPAKIHCPTLSSGVTESLHYLLPIFANLLGGLRA